MKRSRETEYPDESSQKRYDVSNTNRNELFRLPFVSLHGNPCTDIELPHTLKIGDIFLHDNTAIVLIDYDHIEGRAIFGFCKVKSFIEQIYNKENISSGVITSYDHNLFRKKCRTNSINFIEKRDLLNTLFLFYSLRPRTMLDHHTYDEHCVELRNYLISQRDRVTEWKLN